MRKILLTCVLAAMGFTPLESNAENVITWETLGNYVDDDGNYYLQQFTIDADQPFDRVAFCMFKRQMSPTVEIDTLIELLPGYFAVGSPRFAYAKPGNPVVVTLKTSAQLKNASYMPDAMHLVVDGKAVPARNVIKPMIDHPDQYNYYSKGKLIDPMVYGPEAFAINDSLRSSYRPGPYGGIPTLKSVKLKRKSVPMPDKSQIRIQKVDDARNEYFRAKINSDGVTIYTNSEKPELVADRLYKRMQASADAKGNVPAADIEDWADHPYRALMIDVARNFTSADDMKTLIDHMYDYGLNVLHFHLGDDEAWRVEIPQLPELTAVGSRRGYCTDDNQPFLKQIYSGDGNPESQTPANGFYTVDEYIDLLHYAWDRGIYVIPEYDTPGHCRAAIRAMEYRYHTTGDDSLRLIHDGDTSEYTSAQSFHDNTLNPALDGPYKFWDIVMQSTADIYNQAGVPLMAIHIGGDEVAKHAWDGSEAAQALMKREGMTDQRELHAYFVKRIADIAQKNGIKIMGWQEIALNHTDEYNAAVQPAVIGVNCWTNAGKYGAQMAEKGYPLILSNVDYLYFDQTPTTHPEEPGLVWGGLVDEFKPLHATIDQLCPGTPQVQANVAGISAQLFAETVRSYDMVERYILPRLLGMAERAHNSKPTLSDSEFYGILTGELDKWHDGNHAIMLRQPGIRVIDGVVEMNDAYGKGEIRYTLDGSDPTALSTLYTSPFALSQDASQIRARLFYGRVPSVTSILNID